MKLIIIQQKLNLLVEQQLVLVELLEIHLSGRTYVYQAMRVTGAADPTVAIEDTLEGKLPQRKIYYRSSTWI